MQPSPRFLLTLGFFAVLGSAARASDAGAEFFRARVEPILREHCYKCHSHSAERIRGEFVLDSRDALLAGGASGAAIDLEHPEKSLLLEAVRYTNEDLQMPPPPKGKKLSDEHLAILAEWVKKGVPFGGPAVPTTKIAARPRGKITEEDRQWWAFQPVAKPALPAADGKTGPRAVASTATASPLAGHPVDAFIRAKLAAHALAPAPRAAKPALVRRIYFNLIGLPPTPEQVAAFLADERPDAYERLVDTLLASPRFGERWARHWLDLVRYADGDGYRIDDYRPLAWRYRDYVIAAFNTDKPYDRFVQEQIAGDELWPEDRAARTATGYLCAGIYEYNNRDVEGQVAVMLNDITDTTADVFLGLGVQCARCHDHKFDPILQKDYFRLQAFFAPVLPYKEAVVASAAERAAHEQKFSAWAAKTADLRRQLAELEAPFRAAGKNEAVEKFPPSTRAMIAKPPAERTPYEEVVVQLAWRQVEFEWSDRRLPARIKEPAKSQRAKLLAELQKFAAEKPEPLPVILSAADVGPKAPPITIPKKPALGEIAPGFLSILDPSDAAIPLLSPTPAPAVSGRPEPGTGRRAALARWITDPKNPLTARVIVNRIWQYHFGRGLALNASDFGRLGEQPSHPELLDWLAHWFVENGWSLKRLHRLLVTSAAFTQSTENPLAEAAQRTDPENRLLWRATTRRLEAEQIRDAMLAVSGELQIPAGGPGADPSKPVRSIYTRLMRNTHDAVTEAFDQPEGIGSTAQRNVTTTPTQSLLMINGRWPLERAKAFAARLQREHPHSTAEQVTRAFQLGYGRHPTDAERRRVAELIFSHAPPAEAPPPREQPAPFASEKMKFRDGTAALIAPHTEQDRLVIPQPLRLPGGGFTAEAFINLRSVHASGTVSPIVSNWSGKKGEPGWSLGVTGKGSRNTPQTLVLQLSGATPWKPHDPVEPIFSGLHIDLGKPYFVAVAVNVADPSPAGVTFYAKDLSNDDEPVQVAQVAHSVTSGVASTAPVVIGGNAGGARNLFDGTIDDVRLSDVPLRGAELLFNTAAVNEHTMGFWKFETANPYADSSGRGRAIAPVPAAPNEDDPHTKALASLCHVLLNSNEFLYVD